VTAPRSAAVTLDGAHGEQVKARLTLEGAGLVEIATGDALVDHLLELAARHARFDLSIAIGDGKRGVSPQVEAVATAFGRALREALGAGGGIRGAGSATMPRDEALALVALDLAGHAYLAYDIDLAGERIEEFDADLAGRFLRTLVEAAGITLHVRLLSGSDPHHIVDAVFVGLGEALRTACETLVGSA
jgi:imidazoleglycerol-phosphate dehydratase